MKLGYQSSLLVVTMNRPLKQHTHWNNTPVKTTYALRQRDRVDAAAIELG